MTPSMIASQILIEATAVSHRIGEGDIPEPVHTHFWTAITKALSVRESEDRLRRALYELVMIFAARPDIWRLCGFAEKTVVERAREVVNATCGVCGNGGIEEVCVGHGQVAELSCSRCSALSASEPPADNAAKAPAPEAGLAEEIAKRIVDDWYEMEPVAYINDSDDQPARAALIRRIVTALRPDPEDGHE